MSSAAAMSNCNITGAGEGGADTTPPAPDSPTHLAGEAYTYESIRTQRRQQKMAAKERRIQRLSQIQRTGEPDGPEVLRT